MTIETIQKGNEGEKGELDTQQHDEARHSKDSFSFRTDKTLTGALDALLLSPSSTLRIVRCLEWQLKRNKKEMKVRKGSWVRGNTTKHDTPHSANDSFSFTTDKTLSGALDALVLSPSSTLPLLYLVQPLDSLSGPRRDRSFSQFSSWCTTRTRTRRARSGITDLVLNCNPIGCEVVSLLANAVSSLESSLFRVFCLYLRRPSSSALANSFDVCVYTF
jgi:hypothetical protein